MQFSGSVHRLCYASAATLSEKACRLAPDGACTQRKLRIVLAWQMSHCAGSCCGVSATRSCFCPALPPACRLQGGPAQPSDSHEEITTTLRHLGGSLAST